MKYVFLDTNVFLQFKDLEQIPWGELVRDNDFTIIVSDVVSREKQVVSVVLVEMDRNCHCIMKCAIS